MFFREINNLPSKPSRIYRSHYCHIFQIEFADNSVTVKKQKVDKLNKTKKVKYYFLFLIGIEGRLRTMDILIFAVLFIDLYSVGSMKVTTIYLLPPDYLQFELKH